jgi:hypothetical protein
MLCKSLYGVGIFNAAFNKTGSPRESTMHISSFGNTLTTASSSAAEIAKPNETNSSFSGVMSAVVRADQAASYSMDTNLGSKSIKLDEYLYPKPIEGQLRLQDMPLILPTAHNVDVLSNYSEAKFNSLLSDYGIPSAPKTIKFDGEGKLVLPPNYPYTQELNQALSDHPEVENALRTTTAIASHYAGMMEGSAFRDEMTVATTKAEQDFIIQKYSYLFDDKRQANEMVLSFLDDGGMLVGQERS